MWSPTHVQVTVQRAKNLLTKGKHKTNDCFVTIALGKEKYQTSVKEKASKDVEWHEECELLIPEQGNTAEINLTALHRNFLGVDEFLGTVNIPLSSFDVYERPRNRWYSLSSKPGKENTKERGELEVKIGFIVKAGSLTDLSRKERHKSSLGQLSTAAHSIGGSLLSIGSLEKRKGLKKLAKSIGNRVKGAKSRSKLDRENDLDEREETIAAKSRQEPGEADPGVISEDEDEFTFDDLSHKSSASSLNVSMTALSSGNSGGESTIATVSSNGRTASHVNVSSALGPGIDRSTTSTLPLTVAAAPNKPPRFGISSSTTSLSKIDGQKEDEWGLKLYGKQASSIPKCRWEAKTNPRIVVDDSSSRSDFVDWHENDLNIVPLSILSIPSSQQQQEQEEEQQQLPPPPPPPPPPLAASITRSPSPTIRQLRETTTLEPPSPAPREILQTKSSREDRFLPSTKENRIGSAKNPKEEKHVKKEKRKEREKENRPRDVNEDAHPSSERIIIGGEDTVKTPIVQKGRLPHEVVAQFDGKSREDLIELIFQLKADLADKKKRLTDLEDYIDALLLRVIECSPRLLQNPFHMQRRLSSPGHQ